MIELVESCKGRPRLHPIRPMFCRAARLQLRSLAETACAAWSRHGYSIASVTCDAAQDVTGLEERLCLERIASGQLTASVKYDPANPSNSILVADDWSGLH